MDKKDRQLELLSRVMHDLIELRENWEAGYPLDGVHLGVVIGVPDDTDKGMLKVMQVLMGDGGNLKAMFENAVLEIDESEAAASKQYPNV